jgi:3-deoxy-manno-octulosonate cytidylyltransferase (CMP-KDO synthetase)
MKIYAFIPARYDSQRFPGKPLAMLLGKPMIQHVFERASRCPGLAGVHVATDDERIAACVRSFGGRAVMTDCGHRSGTDRISEAAERIGLQGEDIVVNIQGDQPAFHPSIIPSLLGPLLGDRSLGMSTLSFKFIDERDIGNPHHVKVVTDREGNALYFSRCPIPFSRDGRPGQNHYKHLGFYGFRMSFLSRFTRLEGGVLEATEKLEQLRALEHGFKIRVVPSPYNSIEVDVPEDVASAEAALRALPSKGDKQVWHGPLGS